MKKIKETISISSRVEKTLDEIDKWFNEDRKGYCKKCGSIIGEIVKDKSFLSSNTSMHISRIAGESGMLEIAIHYGNDICRVYVSREDWSQLTREENKDWRKERRNKS